VRAEGQVEKKLMRGAYVREEEERKRGRGEEGKRGGNPRQKQLSATDDAPRKER
jgi:hypothetical protein